MPEPEFKLSPLALYQGTNLLLQLDHDLSLNPSVTGITMPTYGQQMPTFQLQQPKKLDTRKRYSLANQLNRVLANTGSTGQALSYMVTDIVKNKGLRLYGLERAIGANKVVLSGNIKPQFNQNPFKALINGDIGDLKITGADFKVQINILF